MNTPGMTFKCEVPHCTHRIFVTDTRFARICGACRTKGWTAAKVEEARASSAQRQRIVHTSISSPLRYNAKTRLNNHVQYLIHKDEHDLRWIEFVQQLEHLIFLDITDPMYIPDIQRDIGLWMDALLIVDSDIAELIHTPDNFSDDALYRIWAQYRK